MPLYQLQTDNIVFPPLSEALEDPAGLLAIGGDLSVKRLLNAYQSGIFPWFGEGDPILWWAPTPRMVLRPDKVKVSRSMAKLMRQQRYQITFDHAFERVVKQCAQTPRNGQSDKQATWIVPAIQIAYKRLFAAGHAHSIEIWDQATLVGGLYGVAIGKMFCGESMFSHRSNASKLAFVALAQWLSEWQFDLIDCQLPTPHLASLGAYEIDRSTFEEYLQSNAQYELGSHWNNQGV
ncbi:MAG: leucyl/phenylalanyl-tRNA--protein transferase [Gammaproteobacteria bacterium]|jgi:leucyl/phenylalanyl-tRNA--protein transferase|nr:leucyl/phenylalanyl-tRNA--protein transferase [Gammaproteobacteria bacterium]